MADVASVRHLGGDVGLAHVLNELRPRLELLLANAAAGASRVQHVLVLLVRLLIAQGGHLFEAVMAKQVLARLASVVSLVNDVSNQMLHQGDVVVESVGADDALDVERAVLVANDAARLAGHVGVVESVQVRLRRSVQFDPFYGVGVRGRVLVHYGLWRLLGARPLRVRRARRVLHLAQGRRRHFKFSGGHAGLQSGGGNDGQRRHRHGHCLGLLQVVPVLEWVHGYVAQSVDQLLGVVGLGLLGQVRDDVVEGERRRVAPNLAPRQLIQELLYQAAVQQRQRVQEHARHNLKAEIMFKINT